MNDETSPSGPPLCQDFQGSTGFHRRSSQKAQTEFPLAALHVAWSLGLGCFGFASIALKRCGIPLIKYGISMNIPTYIMGLYGLYIKVYMD